MIQFKPILDAIERIQLYSWENEKKLKLYLSLSPMAGTEPGAHYQIWPQTLLLPVWSNAGLSIQHFAELKIQ